MAIKAFASLLTGKCIQILTDNISAMAYVNHMGGSEPHIVSASACHMGRGSRTWNHSMLRAYCGDKKKQESDYWFRTPDKHNWIFHPRVFAYTGKIWDPHTIDRGSRYVKIHRSRFNSRYWDPMSEGIDALAQVNWGFKNNFVNAPFCLMSRVLDITQNQGAFSTIIAPKWQEQVMCMLISPQLTLLDNSKIMWATGVSSEPCQNKKWKLFAWRVYGGIILWNKAGLTYA